MTDLTHQVSERHDKTEQLGEGKGGVTQLGGRPGSDRARDDDAENEMGAQSTMNAAARQWSGAGRRPASHSHAKPEPETQQQDGAQQREPKIGVLRGATELVAALGLVGAVNAASLLTRAVGRGGATLDEPQQGQQQGQVAEPAIAPPAIDRDTVARETAAQVAQNLGARETAPQQQKQQPASGHERVGAGDKEREANCPFGQAREAAVNLVSKGVTKGDKVQGENAPKAGQERNAQHQQAKAQAQQQSGGRGGGK